MIKLLIGPLYRRWLVIKGRRGGQNTILRDTYTENSAKGGKVSGQFTPSDYFDYLPYRSRAVLKGQVKFPDRPTETKGDKGDISFQITGFDESADGFSEQTYQAILPHTNRRGSH